MAGSLKMIQHDLENCNGFTDPRCLIENMGDAWEAFEEAIAEIERLQANVHLAFYEGWDDAKHSNTIDVDNAWDRSDAKKALAKEQDDCEQLKQEIEAEMLLVTLTERLLWFADERGAIFAPQIRKLVKAFSIHDPKWGYCEICECSHYEPCEEQT